MSRLPNRRLRRGSATGPAWPIPESKPDPSSTVPGPGLTLGDPGTLPQTHLLCPLSNRPKGPRGGIDTPHPQVSLFCSPPFLLQPSSPSQTHLPLIRTPRSERVGSRLTTQSRASGGPFWDSNPPLTEAQAGRWTRPGGENPKLLPTSEQAGGWACQGGGWGAGGSGDQQRGPVSSRPAAPGPTQSPRSIGRS